jgi:hydroxymethylpyrimidine pyrophosphatase-like HAD family hydrolase
MEKFTFPFDRQKIPKNGIYILFEKGEIAHSGDRIVRIGTHTGKNQLLSRLNQHFLKENKDRSILRKNIGRALLNKDKDPFLEKWEWDLTTKSAKAQYCKLINIEKQKEIEKKVTQFIQNNFFFIVFQVDDKDNRLYLESRIISTVSLCEECCSSANWLGRFSPKEKIKKSGLWLVNELWKTPLNEEDMIKLKKIINNN